MIITAGEFKGHKILSPDEKYTRPTLSKVRMAVFNTLQSLIEFEGGSFYDMYAGSGIMGLEALSRGFETLFATEKNPKVIPILKNNYGKFVSRRKIKLVTADAIKTALLQNKIFDVVYIDPPYYSGIYEESLAAVRHFAKMVIIEHVVEVDFSNWEILRQKKYSDKCITFLSPARFSSDKS